MDSVEKRATSRENKGNVKGEKRAKERKYL